VSPVATQPTPLRSPILPAGKPAAPAVSAVRVQPELAAVVAPSVAPVVPEAVAVVVAGTGLPAWQRGWWYARPGERITQFWIAFIHVLVVVGLICLPLPAWWVFVASYALLWIGGLGTTVAYHRCLAHRALDLHPVVLQPLLFFAIFNGSGSPASWVTDHRHHHAHSDKEGDISSPRQGFWWSHLRWLWQAEKGSPERFARDLTPAVKGWERFQIPMLALSSMGGLLLVPWLGWTGALAAALWLGPIRLVYALHVQCTVNSICHLGAITAEHGSAKNIPWLLVAHMGQGENWHGNHHDRPASPRLGHGPQVDIGWYTICVLSVLRLASKIKPIR
jgi:stearoyl-CoA desaturase (delta-9 desaturase)